MENINELEEANANAQLALEVTAKAVMRLMEAERARDEYKEKYTEAQAYSRKLEQIMSDYEIACDVCIHCHTPKSCEPCFSCDEGSSLVLDDTWK